MQMILQLSIAYQTKFCCYLVSRRFSSIVVQVDAISLTALSLSPRIPDKNTVGYVDGGSAHDSDVCLSGPLPPIISSLYGESFLSAYGFLSKFKEVKSLRIELPYSSHRAVDNRCLFKWKVKFDHKIESFIFLWPTSICDKDGSYVNGNGFEEEANQQLVSDSIMPNFATSLKCLNDVILRHRMLLYIVKDVPMLEEVSITDSEKLGRLSLSGKKLNEVKEWVHSASETEMNHEEVPDVLSHGFIPTLNLPVSGYVMKRIYCGVMGMENLQGGTYILKKSEDGFEDKEEAIYTEAMMEILKKHRGMLHTSCHSMNRVRILIPRP